ncbi:hypothetical protein Bca52824_033878 [Brassica carinata]|uniref:RNase H type-1 domain-containing protein n=1 Tax=Brassica carinata TaxID=52824 RepID=A0A8X7SFA3_BRACI|nr:hypothetical protein Bca52824_033878 [Brassica carinata]
MRRYLRADTGENHAIKVDKVQSSVRMAEKDPISQKTVLRLEQLPVITSDVNKGKGLVFNYTENMGESSALSIPSNPNKLLAGSFKAHSALSARSAPEMKMLCYDKIESGSECSMTPDYPTVFQTGNSKSVYSGVVKKRPAPRKRPPKSVRMQRPRLLMVRGEDSLEDRREGKQEVSSKKRKPEASFQPFAEMLDLCEMGELSSRGDRFTWGGRRCNKYIRCCLDRCFETSRSDHRPVLVHLRANTEVQRGQFRLDKRLLHHPDAKKEVETAWKQNRMAASVSCRIQKCRRVMSAWKWKRRFNARDKIHLLQERLERFQSKPYPCDKFGQDQWSEAAKAEVAIQYFSELFASSNPPSDEPVFQSMAPKVTTAMNNSLTTRFIKSRYFPHSDFLTASLGLKPSFAWRSMLFGRELLQKGLKIQIGNGANTTVWLDNWVDDPVEGMRTPGDLDEKRAWPWVIWFIWKSRNELIFNGVRWSPEDILSKAKTEAEANEEIACTVKQVQRRWKPPSWMVNSGRMGVAWVLRNHIGVVIMHSRRAFSNISNLKDARFKSALWAVESMTSLHFNKIIFAGDFKELFQAAKRPHLWLVIRYQTGELNRLLALMEDFQLLWVSPGENRGATFIAQSVTRQGRLQLYVASGHPDWLFEFFVNESRAL